MTMEMVVSQQDDSAVDSVPERDAGLLQNQPGRSQISPGSEVSVAASSAGRGSPAVSLVQLPSGQTVHVQGVIQAIQPSVIQSPHMQAVQVASIADESAESEGIIDSQKRREILSRRPSYRKILNELSSDAAAVPKIEEEEKSEDEGVPLGISAMAMPTSLYHTNAGQYFTITQGGTIQISNPASDGVHGLQTLTMTNSGAPQPGATIVQYAGQSPDGTQQFFVPRSQVVVQAATGDMPAYQIRTPTTTLPQGVVMAASPGTLHSPQQLTEEATRKRELRLMKNRSVMWLSITYLRKHSVSACCGSCEYWNLSSDPILLLQFSVAPGFWFTTLSKQLLDHKIKKDFLSCITHVFLVLMPFPTV